MIEQSAAEPVCPSPPTGPEVVLLPRAHDIGGFEVRRALPARERQMVGPFIFFDQMGPAEFMTGQGLDVRPHPHIGLATVTYLFEGEILHRDSLGTRAADPPGEVNWMTAGRGIAHSERTTRRRAPRPTACSASRPGSPCRSRPRKRRPRSSTTRRHPASSGRRWRPAAADRR